MTLWAIAVLLALILFLEVRSLRYLATILAEIRGFLDEQPSRIAKHEQHKAELRERWTTEARAPTDGDSLKKEPT